jgi:peptidoglycan/xylan/chitin deacetylase (PgdA/CDA1 family)
MILFKTPRLVELLFSSKMWGFSRSENSVYLTFDDGPDPQITPWILDFLHEQKLKATFFCVGENVLKYPHIFARIKQEGHSVGNHTMNHLKGTKTSLKSYIQNVEEADQLIQSTLFRPPYGRMTFRQTQLLKKRYKIIMWSWLSNDFNKKISPEYILKKAATQIQQGDIIVLHDNSKTAERIQLILPELIHIIAQKGFRIKRIEE